MFDVHVIPDENNWYRVLLIPSSVEALLSKYFNRICVRDDEVRRRTTRYESESIGLCRDGKMFGKVYYTVV